MTVNVDRGGAGRLEEHKKEVVASCWHDAAGGRALPAGPGLREAVPRGLLVLRGALLRRHRRLDEAEDPQGVGG